MDTIAINVTIEEDEFCNAQWLHLKPRPLVGALYLFGAALYTVIVAIRLYQWLSGSLPPASALFTPILAALLIAYFTIYLPGKFKKAYREHETVREPFEMVITEEAFRASSEPEEEAVPWENFFRFKEGKKVFLVYQEGNLFNIIPKRLLSEKQQDWLRRLLSERIAR